jgi:hypothetical protein
MSGRVTVDEVANSAGRVIPVSALSTSKILQIEQRETSSTWDFTGQWTDNPWLRVDNFIPRAAGSRILIEYNFSCENVSTTGWTLYSLRLNVGGTIHAERAIGHHYHRAYSPVHGSYMISSWGTTARNIVLQSAAHSNNTHRMNNWVWAPTAGSHSNTSYLRVTELQLEV